MQNSSIMVAMVSYIILILFLNNYMPVNGELQRLSNGKYFKPGKSCGVLKEIKMLHQLHENTNELKECTIIDMDAGLRQTPVTIASDVIATTTTVATTEAGGEDCILSYIGDGTCDDDCNFSQHDFDGGDCCGGTLNPDYCSICECKQK